jgi:S-adenosylmethionine/arginine decarboxylase-like enzyme
MITTSHIATHFWDVGFARFDVYSCRLFHLQVMLNSLAVFKPRDITWQLVDRN